MSASGPTPSKDADVLALLEECLRDPVLHPDHPGHNTSELQQDFLNLRAALQALYGPTGRNIQPTWTPVCGSLPADELFRDSVQARLRTLKNALDLWDPKDELSDRLDNFEVNGMALLNGLLGADKLKAMVRRGKAYRRPDLVSLMKPQGNGQLCPVPIPVMPKRIVVHYRSHHPHLSPALIKEAYDSWLGLLHAGVRVIDERGQPEEKQTKKLLSAEVANAVDHVYVEDAKLGCGVAAEATLPAPFGKVLHIKISQHADDDSDWFSQYAKINNALGCLRHEVGHTLGFVHENTPGWAAAVDRGLDPTVLFGLADTNYDQWSVMLPGVLQRVDLPRPTPLSNRDTWGCYNCFAPPAISSSTSSPMDTSDVATHTTNTQVALAGTASTQQGKRKRPSSDIPQATSKRVDCHEHTPT